jgi:hypothetical protein
MKETMLRGALMSERTRDELLVMIERRELRRYGLQWNGPKEFVATPMADGYWTPWHVAALLLAERDDTIAALRQACAEKQAGLDSLMTHQAELRTINDRVHLDTIAAQREEIERYKALEFVRTVGVPASGETSAPAPHPLALHAFAMSEEHLSSYRLILGFDTLEQVQAAHQAVVDIARATAARAPTWICPGCATVNSTRQTTCQGCRKYIWIIDHAMKPVAAASTQEPKL